MTAPTFTSPSQDAGSALPFDALTYQNIINAITQSVMQRAPVALTVTGTTTLAGTSGLSVPQYATGQWFWFLAPNACAGATTLSVDGLAAKSVRDRAGGALASGAWNAGDLVVVLYEGTYMRLVGSFDFAAALASGGMDPGAVSGCATGSNTTDPNNDIDIATGFAHSEDNTRDIVLGAPLTKQLDAVWAQGTNQGALLQSANLAGTVSVTNGSNAVAGTGTTFTTDFIVGDVIRTAGGAARIISTITSDVAMTVQDNFTATESGVTYKRGGKAINACYRLFAIRRAADGAADIAASTRDTPVDLPAGWSTYARIAYVLTDGAGNNRPYVQSGDRFMLLAQLLDSNAVSQTLTTAVPTLSHNLKSKAPPGVEALYRAVYESTATATGNRYYLFRRTDQTSVATSLGLETATIAMDGSGAPVTGIPIAADFAVQLDASSQLAVDERLVGSGTTNDVVSLFLKGWIDKRAAGIGGISSNPNSGAVAWTGEISPAQITADQNDYAPAGLAAAAALRLSSDATRNITGLTGGASGRLLLINNIGTFNIVLKAENAASAAANRFALADDFVIRPNAGVALRYDLTSLRWRRIEATQEGRSDVETSIASAATCDIGTSNSERVLITGTTTITSFGTRARQKRLVRFGGALTLTHNAASLILMTGANRAIAAGDIGLYASDGAGNWREYGYFSAAGYATRSYATGVAVAMALIFGG